MEKQKLILIALAIFSMSIILAQNNIEQVYALTIETAVIGGTGQFSPYEDRECDYVTSTQVWCPTTTGIKIWNPTSRSLTATLDGSLSINDVHCNLLCYSWDNTSGTTWNLTSWRISDHTMINRTTFINNAGFIGGHQFALVTGSGSETLVLPTEGQVCKNSNGNPLGNTDEKGLCIFDGIAWSGSRFITTSVTNDIENNYAVIWNQGVASVSDPSANRVIVKHRDVAGNFQYYNINLADSDTTFALTKVCDSGNISGGLTTQNKLFMQSGILYDGINNDLWTMDTTNSSCSEIQKVNLVDESVITGLVYDSTNNIYFITSATDGTTETNSVNLYNGTTFSGSAYDRILKVNITSTANNFAWAVWIHISEGEIHVWRGSNVVIISDILTASEPNPNTEFCDQPENFNLLRCVLERGDTTPLVGASELVNASSTNIVCQIGLIACTQNEDGSFSPNDPNIQTNGVGYIILFVALGIMIGIYWVASRGDLGSIPTFLWVISTIAIVGVVTAFGWIDPSFIVISIIAVIALATAKAKGLFGSSGLFSGET